MQRISTWGAKPLHAVPRKGGNEKLEVRLVVPEATQGKTVVALFYCLTSPPKLGGLKQQ